MWVAESGPFLGQHEKNNPTYSEVFPTRNQAATALLNKHALTTQHYCIVKDTGYLIIGPVKARVFLSIREVPNDPKFILTQVRAYVESQRLSAQWEVQYAITDYSHGYWAGKIMAADRTLVKLTELEAYLTEGSN